MRYVVSIYNNKRDTSIYVPGTKSAPCVANVTVDVIDQLQNDTVTLENRGEEGDLCRWGTLMMS